MSSLFGALSSVVSFVTTGFAEEATPTPTTETATTNLPQDFAEGELGGEHPLGASEVANAAISETDFAPVRSGAAWDEGGPAFRQRLNRRLGSVFSSNLPSAAPRAPRLPFRPIVRSRAFPHSRICQRPPTLHREWPRFVVVSLLADGASSVFSPALSMTRPCP